MDIEECIQRIVDNGKIEDMDKLSEILEDVLEHLEECDYDKYKKYEMELYMMAYGKVLSEEMAMDIVEKMRPYRMKWSIDETRRMQQDYGIGNVRDVDFFVVMNSAYNDYNDIFRDDVDGYIKYTMDFINDEDAKEDKVFIYYTEIPN